MLKTSLGIAVVTTVLAITSIAPAIAAPRDFIGTWVARNNTRGITKVIITRGYGRRLIVKVFGSCTPRDCDWGNSRLITYGNSVRDRDHVYGTTLYNKRFANKFLTIYLGGRGRRRMSLRQFTQFKDGSRRQNYSTRTVLTKL
ncbi:MAG: hypothetical protein QNJ63_21780 [Calothrix sp. MO_192.B10]|nr:hypothetical protein [Calothrix sp. MO_192.B10]